MTLMHKKWHHSHLRLSLPVTQSTSEPLLQGELPPKEPRHGNLRSPWSRRDSATTTTASFGEILTVLQHSKLCISIPSCAFILFLSWLSPASAWRTPGPTALLSVEIELLMHRNRWDFFCVCLNFFPCSLLPLEESLGFQGKCNSPLFKVVFN